MEYESSIFVPTLDSKERLYIGRVTGGDCHHWHFGRIATAGDTSRTGGRPPDAVQKSAATARDFFSATPRHAQVLPFRRLGLAVARFSRPGLWREAVGRMALQRPAVYGRANSA